MYKINNKITMILLDGKKTSDDIKDEIEAYRAKIVSGEIVVPSSR